MNAMSPFSVLQKGETFKSLFRLMSPLDQIARYLNNLHQSHSDDKVFSDCINNLMDQTAIFYAQIRLVLACNLYSIQQCSDINLKILCKDVSNGNKKLPKLQDLTQLFQKIMSLDLIFEQKILSLKEKKVKDIENVHLRSLKIDFQGLLYSAFKPTSDNLVEVTQTAKELGIEKSSSYINFMMRFYYKLDSEGAIKLKDDLFDEFLKSDQKEKQQQKFILFYATNQILESITQKQPDIQRLTKLLDRMSK